MQWRACKKVHGESCSHLHGHRRMLAGHEHPSKQAKDDEIKESCGLLTGTPQQLDLAFSILRKPHATPKEDDHDKLENAIDEVKKLWKQKATRVQNLASEQTKRAL
mmetsp:Transcript_25920/g.36342  ORF Transcript_25920/g.36342 Transcript_25920/m.36342 type:complete len:106 (-) Transcript_25920:67-384(-)